MRRKIAAVFMLIVASVLVLATPSDIDDQGTVLKFSVMTGVTGPYVGPTNPIRGLPGGNMRWIIADGRGHLKSNGELKIRTRGLILPDPPFDFTNPLPDFRAIVSCQSIDATNNPTVVNVITDSYPADTAGNSDLKTIVSLPQPCVAPIIFVVHPTSDPPRWFATTGL
jgi:hypothetical protein